MKRSLRGWMITAAVTAICAAPAFAADAETPGQAIDRAYQLVRVRKADVAKSLLEDAVTRLKGQVTQTPDDAQAHYDLGRALWLLGQRGGAIEAATKAVQLKPDDSTYRLTRFEYLRAVGRVNDTIEDLKRLTETSPDDAALWFELGRSYVLAKAYEDAHKAFDRSAELDPKLPHLHLSIGMLYAREHDHDKALEAFERQVKLTPDDFSTNYNLGQIHHLRGDYAKALEYFNVAAKADPNHAGTLAKLVQCHQTLGDNAARDDARKKLVNLYNEGRLGAKQYCRDQFAYHGHRVVVMEYFTLEGDKPKRYEFIILSAASSVLEYRITLGSSELTTKLSRRAGLIDADQRIFHLDGDTALEHDSYALYKAEPTYDEVRKQVLSILNGELKPNATLQLGD